MWGCGDALFSLCFSAQSFPAASDPLCCPLSTGLVSRSRAPRASRSCKISFAMIVVTLVRVPPAYHRGRKRGVTFMKRSEYLREAARLRALIAEATTAMAKQHLEEQAIQNETLALGRSKIPSIAADYLNNRAA